MNKTNRDHDDAIREYLDRFFNAYPNQALQERAVKALELLLARNETLAQRQAGWAGGIVYAVGSRGVGVPGLLNRELGVRPMNRVFHC